MLLIGGSRFCWRMFRDSFIIKSTNKKRTLIIGAGSAGTMIARQLLKIKEVDIIPVGFIDDDPRKQNLDILGIPVVGQVQVRLKKKLKNCKLKTSLLPFRH